MNNPLRHTFPKSERLCSKKVIDELFLGGHKSYSAYPLRVIFMERQEPGVQILISVSKRRFKHAVDRNRVKRQIREAYRLNKHILQPTHGLCLAFLWLSSEHVPSQTVTQKVVNLLQRVKENE